MHTCEQTAMDAEGNGEVGYQPPTDARGDALLVEREEGGGVPVGVHEPLGATSRQQPPLVSWMTWQGMTQHEKIDG